MLGFQESGNDVITIAGTKLSVVSIFLTAHFIKSSVKKYKVKAPLVQKEDSIGSQNYIPRTDSTAL